MKKSALIYLDESGDLGWSFDKPYRQGGSSRFLTIAGIITSKEDNTHVYPKRLIKKLYQKYNWDQKQEVKWSHMTMAQRIYFAKKVNGMMQSNRSMELVSIIVYKPKVQEHIRKDPNKLYNFMIRLLLIDQMSKFDHVLFHPDPRSIKVESGNSLHDYLQTELWFTKAAPTILSTVPQDSVKNKGVQFADMLSGVVQQHFEDRKSKPFEAIKHLIKVKKLYFPSAAIVNSNELIEA